MKVDGDQADDFLGAAVQAEVGEGRAALVFNLNDRRDLFQLASKQTIWPSEPGQRELAAFGPAEVKEIYAARPRPRLRRPARRPVRPHPGREGHRPGSCCDILAKHGSLEACLKAGGFPDQADVLREYLRMTRVQTDAPLPDLPDVDPDWETGGALAESWGLAGVAKRFRERAA